MLSSSHLQRTAQIVKKTFGNLSIATTGIDFTAVTRNQNLSRHFSS